MSDTNVAAIKLKPIDIARSELQSMEDQFKLALPAHIPAERFARVVMTAIQQNPKLLECDRRSLWGAAMKAAQDGLLPDGRDGAIVPYGEDEDGNAKAKIAQWMPMIGGIRKKARNSGELLEWYAHVVYDGDHFDYQLGDEPRLFHKPVRPTLRTGGIICAYSIAVLKDGQKTAPEVMWIEDIEKIRAKSKAKKGPWADPTFYPEMCRKTVARRHAKVLPMSSDLDDLIRRDDELYDLDGAREEGKQRNGGRAQSLTTALDSLARLPTSPSVQASATIIDHQPASDATASSEGGQQEPSPAGQPAPASNGGALDGAGAGTNPKRPARIDLELELKKKTTPREVFDFLREKGDVIKALNGDDRTLFDTAVMRHQDNLKKSAKD